MSHNVYILGAGFSQEAGLPLISNFKDKMIDARDQLQQAGDDEYFSLKRVLEFRETAAQACEYVNFSPNNIEQLFSLASAREFSLSDDVCRAIAATLHYAQKSQPGGLPQYRAQFAAAKGKIGLIGSLYKHYAYFFSGRTTARATKNSVITLNYDTLLEDDCREARVEFNYGDESEDDESLMILKLHGSVNWTTAGVFANYDDVRARNEIPLLLPPTWNKFINVPRVQTAWLEAVRSLKTATRIIVIGFSFPPSDHHFRFLLAAGLMGNIALKQILVVNPDQGVATQNLTAMLTEGGRELLKLEPNTARGLLFSRERLVELERVDQLYEFNYA